MVGCDAMMKRFGILAMLPLALGLASCQSGSDSDTVRIGRLIYAQISGKFGDDAISRERVVSIPYATLGVRLGGSMEGLFVLTGVSGDDLQWLGGQISLSTRDGRVTRTVGLPHNLDGFQGPFPDRPKPDSGNSTYHYVYDLIDRNAYGVVVRCSQSDAGPETITIIGLKHSTRHIVERCEAQQIKWSFQNDFWVDAATGAVWKSVQYVNPDLDSLTIQTLRPAKG
jgi:hypothetical protein